MAKAWNVDTRGRSALDAWQQKVRNFRKSARGWSVNVDAAIRRNKKSLMEDFDVLDIKSEEQELSEGEREVKGYI